MPDPAPSDRPDPYVVRRPEEGADADAADLGTGGQAPARVESRPPADSRSGPPDPDAVRQGRTLGLLAAIATTMAVAVPPAGFIVGVVTLVLTMRHRRAVFARLRMSPRVVSVGGGVFALVVGGALTFVALFLGDETGQLRECLTGANTRVAEQICQDEFMDSLRHRLIGP